MLIRTQVIVALPVIILFAFLARPKEIKPLIKSVFLMVITIALVVSPWLWRNWKLTGEFIFDSPESQTANLALRYSRLNGVEPEIMPLPGESNVEYVARLNQIAKNAIVSNPLGAAWGVSNAFLNHAVNNILLFPIRNNLNRINELWIPTNAFWEGWEGTPNFFPIHFDRILYFPFWTWRNCRMDTQSLAWSCCRWRSILPIIFGHLLHCFRVSALWSRWIGRSTYIIWLACLLYLAAFFLRLMAAA